MKDGIHLSHPLLIILQILGATAQEARTAHSQIVGDMEHGHEAGAAAPWINILARPQGFSRHPAETSCRQSQQPQRQGHSWLLWVLLACLSAYHLQGAKSSCALEKQPAIGKNGPPFILSSQRIMKCSRTVGDAVAVHCDKARSVSKKKTVII